MDNLTREQRRYTMAAVRSNNTGPERIVRSQVHRLGYRFRLYKKQLPGKPDLVLPRYALAIFVHGCFWHGHRCGANRRTPRTNADYWARKIEGNKRRDKRNTKNLKKLGYRILVVWECQIKRPDFVVRLREHLERVKLADGPKVEKKRDP